MIERYTETRSVIGRDPELKRETRYPFPITSSNKTLGTLNGGVQEDLLVRVRAVRERRSTDVTPPGLRLLRPTPSTTEEGIGVTKTSLPSLSVMTQHRLSWG